MSEEQCVVHLADAPGDTSALEVSTYDVEVLPSIPEEPASASEEPARVSDEPARASEEPASVSEDSAGDSKEPASMPDKVTYVPDQYYHVVSIAHGFIAAYYDWPSVRECFLKKFSMVPFITQRFHVVANCPTDTVWVVLFRANDAVAFVSNSREEAEKVRAAYAKIGLAYDDSIDYWECKVGTITDNKLNHLTSMDRAHQIYAGPIVEEERKKREEEELAQLDKFLQPIENGPIETLLRETKEISIFDGLVSADES